MRAHSAGRAEHQVLSPSWWGTVHQPTKIQPQKSLFFKILQSTYKLLLKKIPIKHQVTMFTSSAQKPWIL